MSIGVSVKLANPKEDRSAEAKQRCGSKESCSCAKLRRISREQRHSPTLYGTIQRWSSFQNPGQIVEGIQPSFLGCLDQAVNHRAGLGAQRGIGKQEVLAANHKGLDAALRPVVAQFQPSILQISQEIGPEGSRLYDKGPSIRRGFPGNRFRSFRCCETLRPQSGRLHSQSPMKIIRDTRAASHPPNREAIKPPTTPTAVTIPDFILFNPFFMRNYTLASKRGL